MSDAGLDYLGHLAADSARFAEVLSGTPAAARVPDCPDWDADDLLWHLGEVQWFWGTVVSRNVDADEAEALKPARPLDRPGLTSFFAESTRVLQESLAAADPKTPAWTWSSDQTVGFIRRRQAHEALIHRLDAELTADPASRTALDSALSSDGVDEVLRVMYGGAPEWGAFTPDQDRTLRVVATDTADTWLVTLGRFTGSDPDGTSVDEPDVRVVRASAESPAAAVIEGTAADLDCWLWHRPTLGALARSGEPQVLDAFDAIIARGIT